MTGRDARSTADGSSRRPVERSPRFDGRPVGAGRQGNGTWAITIRPLVLLWVGLVATTLVASPGMAQSSAEILQSAVIEAIAKAERSVVAIASIPKNTGTSRLGLLDLQRQFLDPDQLPVDRLEPTSPDYLPGRFSSGVILDQSGHIVTTYHSLGDPRKHDYVIWHGGESGRAVRVTTPPQVLAGDPWTDLAVLKVPPLGQPIELSQRTELRRGTFVVALGNPYALARDGRPSAAWGIVANLRRPAPPLTQAGDALPKPSLHHYGTLIQVDLRLPLGTSGGALVDLEGKLVGLTTSLAPLVGYETPAGFAIPVDATFRQAVEQLKSGRVPAFGFLGVQPEDLTPRERQLVGGGARVIRVVAGTAAANAKIAVGDIITHVNGQPVSGKDELIRHISSLPAASTASLAIHRLDAAGKTRKHLNVAVRLNKKPLETWLAAYESTPPRLWRGMRVDEATAVPLALRRQSGAVPDPRGCVGVLDVAPESLAWKAGLRPGLFVTHVNSKRVQSVQQFFQLVGNHQSEVVLRVIDGGTGRRDLPVAAQ